jgi:hypothetical protein
MSRAARVALFTLFALTIVVVAGAGAGAARARTAIGERGMVDIHGTAADQLALVLGLAASADGTAFVADVSGARASVPDDCGRSYVPVRLHVLKQDGTQPARRTLPFGPAASRGGTAVATPVTLARTATRAVLLVGVDPAFDANGDGTCSAATTRPVLLALDPDTLQTLGSFTSAQLGGLTARRLSAVPVASGATPLIVLGARDTTNPLTLARFEEIPDTPGTLRPTWTRRFDDGLPVTNQFCVRPSLYRDPWIAARPDGGVLLSSNCTAATVWAFGAGGSAPVAWRSKNDELPFDAGAPIAVTPDGTVLLDHRIMGVDANGFNTSARAGVARLTSDGRVRDAFGLQDTQTFGPCTFGGIFPSALASPIVTAAGSDTVVTASEDPTDPYYGPQSGPRLRWFGDGPLQPACIVRPLPLARLTAAPAETTPGQPVEFDASASAARHFGTEQDNELVSVEWRIGEGQYSPPGGLAELRRTLSFAEPGTYPIDVRLTDAYGQQGIGRYDLFVAAPDPVAQLSAPTAPKVGELVKLDASASTGPPVRYEFDVDGDGRFETDAASESSIEHRYTQAGPIDVGLRVTNNAGVSATTTLPIDVQRPGDPAPPERAQDGNLPRSPGAAAAEALLEAPPRPIARLRPASALRAGDLLRVTVSCLADGADCAGHLTLERAAKHGGRTRRVAASTSSTVLVRAGSTRAVDVRLGPWARAALRRDGRVKLVAAATLRAATGTVVVRRSAPVRAARSKASAR